MIRLNIKIIYIFCFYLLQSSTNAQQLIVNEIKDATQHKTSYYDVFQASNKNIYLCGKNGVFATYINDSIKLIKLLPTHLYKIIELPNSQLLITGNKGFIFFYDIINNTITEHKLYGYEYASLYNAHFVSNKIYLCGGATAISAGKKTIPRGFVLVSIDNGKTWSKEYKSLTHMVWDVHESKNQLSILTYAPWGTNYRNLNTKKNIFKKKIILHQRILNQENTFCGGTYTKKDKSGLLITADGKQFKFNNFCWSGLAIDKYILTTHSKGDIYLVNPLTEKHINYNHQIKPVNLYESINIGDNQFIVVGNSNTVLKVKVNLQVEKQVI